MAWSLQLGKLFRIPVRVHWTMLLLLLFFSWGGGLYGLVAGAISMTLLFGSVLAHELAHALVARRFGIGTHEILLLPIGGIAKIARQPENGKQEVAIALAGPLTSLALGGIAFGLTFVLDPTGVASTVARTLTYANLMLGAFNLLPAFPMDGGRVLRGALRHRQGLLRATEIAARIGRYVAVPMAVAGIALGQFTLVLVAGFVWLAGRSELAMVQQLAEQARFAPWTATPDDMHPAPKRATTRTPDGRPIYDAEIVTPRERNRPPRRFVIEIGPFGYAVREVH